MRIQKLLIALGLTLPTLLLTAQELTVDTAHVDAHRLSASEHAAVPHQTIGSAEIERMGLADVADAVRHMSGVQVKDYGGIGGLKTVSVRGLGAQHTAVMYDGVAVSDCQTGQVDISRYGVAGIDNVTLIIGQDNDIFTSARSLASAGVLQINTATLQTTSRMTLKTGSYGMLNPSILVQKYIGTRWHISTFADYTRADGNYHFHMKNGNRSIDEKRNNSDIETWKGEANLTYIPSENQRLTIKLYGLDSERGLPGNVVYDNPYAAERLHDRNYMVQARWDNTISTRWRLSASGKADWWWNRYTDKQAAGLTDERFRQFTTYASLVAGYNANRHLSLSIANDAELGHLHATTSACPYPTRFTWLAALSAHYSAGIADVTASLLNTYITEHVEQGQAAPDRHRLSPALSLSIRPLPTTNWRLRVSYKDIFRNPTFNDLYYQLLGTRTLRPEKTRQLNIGTLWSTYSKGWLTHIALTADAYYGRVDDKIVAIPRLFFWSMSNVGKVETRGIDLTANAEAKLAGVHLYANATYNYMQARDITNSTSPLWHNQLPYTPLHSGSANLAVEHPWLSVAYNLVWTGQRYSMAQNYDGSRIRPYADHSIAIYRDINIGHDRIRLRADLLNIGGKNYEVVRFYPMPGRNLKFTLTYHFN